MKKAINEYYQSIRPQMVASFMKFGQLPEGIDLKEKVNDPIYEGTISMLCRAYCLSEDTVKSILSEEETLTESKQKKAQEAPAKKVSKPSVKLSKKESANEAVEEKSGLPKKLSPAAQAKLDAAEDAMEGDSGNVIEAPYVPGKIEEALDEALQETIRSAIGIYQRDDKGKKIQTGTYKNGKPRYKRYPIHNVEDLKNYWGGEFQLKHVPNTNVLLVGTPGVGKTERVISWCKHNGLKLVSFKGDSLSEDDFAGIPTISGEAKDKLKNMPDTDENHRERVKLAYYGTFDQLDDDDAPPTIVFIDEFNRCKDSVMHNWMDLLQGHKLVSKEEGNAIRYFNRLVFAVAAMNPSVLSNGEEAEGDHVAKLSTPVIDRFIHKLDIVADAKETLAFLKGYFENVADAYPEYATEAMNKYLLSEKILNGTGKMPEKEMKNGKLVTKKDANGNPVLRDQTLQFANDIEADAAAQLQQKFLTPRGLSNALIACDGTKENLLKLLPECVGNAGTEQIKAILNSYTNPNIKTNAVWDFWKKKGLDMPDEYIDQQHIPASLKTISDTAEGQDKSSDSQTSATPPKSKKPGMGV